MASRIPPALKKRVIKEWLEGTPRNAISDNCEISEGSVTNIISQARDGDVRDIDLLREVALAMKKENISLSYFAHSIRLKHIYDEIKLFEDQVESFLDRISVHCIENDIEERDFINSVDYVCYVSEMLNVSIAELPEYLHDNTQIDKTKV